MNSPETLAPTPLTATSVAPDAALVAAFRAAAPDVVCFCHLTWEFVWQRPQHLLSRFAETSRVFFIEDPYWHHDAAEAKPTTPHLEIKTKENYLRVVVAHLPATLQANQAQAEAVQEALLTDYLRREKVFQEGFVAWYYTPMAVGKSRSIQQRAAVTVYDCMDELAAFAFAPPLLKDRENELLDLADLVFTGGQSIYEAKAHRHAAIYPFPSSIDKAHFGTARTGLPDPADQAKIPYPRIGFFGVLDERFDRELVAALARRRPDWQFVLIGPVVKINPADLPTGPNLHYPGGKTYTELPAYVGNWDVAALFFAQNESTRFISPTKTPEYLAAGKPTVSTPIRDVVRPYGELKLVQIAETPAEMERAIEAALTQAADTDWRARTDAFLATTSWELTWERMVTLVEGARR